MTAIKQDCAAALTAKNARNDRKRMWSYFRAERSEAGGVFESALPTDFEHGFIGLCRGWSLVMRCRSDEELPTAYNWELQKMFAINGHLCYNLDTSPLFLREQDARRSCTASAFLTDSQFPNTLVDRTGKFHKPAKW
jgi:hypothetical protein